MSNHPNARILGVEAGIWVEAWDTGMEVFWSGEAGRTASITSEVPGTLQFPRTEGTWCVRPRLTYPDAAPDELWTVPGDAALPDLLYVTRHPLGLRAIYLAAEADPGTLAGPVPWSHLASERDLELMDALVRIAQRRIAEVRRGRDGQ